MTELCDSIDFHDFVDEILYKKGCRIVKLTRQLMNLRIDDIMSFVNTIRKEYNKLYKWEIERKEYFLNDLADKWKYSYMITDTINDNIYLLNLSSVYKEVIHNHGTYTLREMRNCDLAKIHMLKSCQTALDNGYERQEGYFPKNNNGSIALHLKMGWEIQSMRNCDYIIMGADHKRVRNQTFELIIKKNHSIIK